MGKKVWVPVVSGPLAPYAAGYREVAEVAGLFAFGGGRQAAPARTGQLLA